ncbi:Na/Pi symporter [Algivirga pacifica]|uniref:Na/Pi symporter n=1 Tax=Algivirga pacifica TaxID=1162670 RepID=A0ABP9DTN1_9BACT
MEKLAKNKSGEILGRVLMLVVVMFVFLVSLKLMSSGFKMMGKDTAESIMGVTSNPFVGLFVGLLATALVQSSSTTTAMIVAIVASGSLPLASAVPMIMGANIGTSVTSTIVALGHLSDKSEFKKAISAATVHDFFNLIVVAILFPLELAFGVLSTPGQLVADMFYVDGAEKTEIFSIMGVTVKPAAKFLISLFNKNVVIVLIVAVGLLFVSLKAFTSILKKILVGNSQKNLEKYVFAKPIQSLTWGMLITAGVQSSSVTTSLAVPLVAANKITLRKAFPFLMGANIGTTVTALLAAMSGTEAGLAIALCHLFFNLFGVLILFPVKIFRNIPIWCAETLGAAAMKNRFIGFAYVLVVFFLIPFALISTTTDATATAQAAVPQTEVVSDTAVVTDSAATVEVTEEVKSSL